MCRIPKVVVVSPPEWHDTLRRSLSSLEYDVAAFVATIDDIGDISADAVVVAGATTDQIDALRARGYKTVALGAEAAGADMHITQDEIATFKTRIWELFRPS